MNENLDVKLTQTYGDHGRRFAGPDLLDYNMIFKFLGSEYDGQQLKALVVQTDCLPVASA